MKANLFLVVMILMAATIVVPTQQALALTPVEAGIAAVCQQVLQQAEAAIQSGNAQLIQFYVYVLEALESLLSHYPALDYILTNVQKAKHDAAMAAIQNTR
jgi:hypothetical protein